MWAWRARLGSWGAWVWVSIREYEGLVWLGERGLCPAGGKMEKQRSRWRGRRKLIDRLGMAVGRSKVHGFEQHLRTIENKVLVEDEKAAKLNHASPSKRQSSGFKKSTQEKHSEYTHRKELPTAPPGAPPSHASTASLTLLHRSPQRKSSHSPTNPGNQNPLPVPPPPFNLTIT